MRQGLLGAILLLLWLHSLQAQNKELPEPNETSQDWTSLIEEIAENAEEEKDTENWQDILIELAENPIPLNTATKEMLESIPFLSEDQVEALSYYLYRYGPIISMAEILLVDGMDEKTLRWLKPFVYPGKPGTSPDVRPTLKDALNYGKQEFRIRAGRVLQKKAGYARTSDSTLNERYAGDPLQLCFRYGFNYKNKMQWGIVFEKDAGERFWTNHKKGIDYSSFHFLLKNQKRIKALILGDYRLRFGQGLACSNNFSLGKSVTGTMPELTGNNLSRHFSTSESNFFRGIGSTFILKPYPEQGSENRTSYGLDMTTFVSLRNKDAAISEGSFSALSTSELHRTKTEIELMDQLKTYTLGTHFSLRTSQGQFGFTALTYGFNACFNPEWKPYNVFYFRGKHGGNASLDYRFRYKGLLFFGESAVDERANLAILSGLSLKPYTRLDMSILLRYYATDYHALYGNGFSESTSTQNECGSFATIEWRLIKKWRFNAYYDVFCFPWLKYHVHSPSFGFDYALQATWIPTATSLISIRFKSKTKARNATDGDKIFKDVVMQQKDQLRLQISTKTGVWVLKTVIDGSRIRSCLPKAPNFGFSASQEADLSPEQTSVSLSVKYAIFDAESYDSRIYSYEKDLPGTFAMTSFYGQGSRLSILFTYKISEFAKIQLKIGQTAYRDRLQVGTGPEQIQGNRLTDVKGMFLWKF